jgi:hypothetical protein
MSRTYRKPYHHWYTFANREAYIKSQLDRFYKGYKHVKVRRSYDEWKTLDDNAQKEYDEAIKANGGEWVEYFCVWRKEKHIRKIYRRIISKYKYVKVDWSKEEAIKEYGQKYDRFSRDGYFSETYRKTGFKNEANRQVRRFNKNFCNKVLKDEWEDEAYPNRKLGKKYKWNWW